MPVRRPLPGSDLLGMDNLAVWPISTEGPLELSHQRSNATYIVDERKDLAVAREDAELFGRMKDFDGRAIHAADSRRR